MKRAALLVSVFAACSAVLTGCSSGDSGSATPSSSAAPSSPASAGSSPANSSAASSSKAATSSPAASDGAGTTTDGAAGIAPSEDGTAPDLDAATVAWFDTFCTGLSPLATLDLSDPAGGPTDTPDPADPDNAIQKQTLVTSLNAVAAAFGDTSQALAAKEPPTFDGGADFASAAAAGLGTAGGQIAAAVTTFDAVAAGNTDEYWTAKSALRTQSQAAVAPLQALADPPVEVQNGVGQIPSCQALGL